MVKAPIINASAHRGLNLPALIRLRVGIADYRFPLLRKQGTRRRQLAVSSHTSSGQGLFWRRVKIGGQINRRHQMPDSGAGAAFSQSTSHQIRHFGAGPMNR